VAVYEDVPGEYNTADDSNVREQLIAMDFTDEWLDMMIADGTCLENVLNQIRFGEFSERIHNNQPIGPSGEVILARYFGGMYFNDEGVLTVMVLEAAFNHAASATAVEEMQELGIIAKTVEFSHDDLLCIMDELFNVHEYARAAGASSWGLGMLNRVEVWLDPYTEEQIAEFMMFLDLNGFDSAMFVITPAVTPEMRDIRAASIAAAVASARDQVVHIGGVEVSRTGIAFTLENRTGLEFSYGAPWDLAYYDYVVGNWVPVENLPGASMFWPGIGFSLQGGGIQHYRQDWEWRFGELTPGRYMFIRDGWLGEWNLDYDRIYVVVEFVITENCPEYLPAVPDEEWPNIINLVEYRNVTPYGMTVVIENISDYDIDHRAQILFIVPERYAVSDYWWEWQQYHLPFLPVDDYWIDYLMQGEGFLPRGGQLEFTLNWETVFGELPPGEYIIALSLGGRAHPPHPTGWAFGETLMIKFNVL